MRCGWLTVLVLLSACRSSCSLQGWAESKMHDYVRLAFFEQMAVEPERIECPGFVEAVKKPDPEIRCEVLAEGVRVPVRVQVRSRDGAVSWHQTGYHSTAATARDLAGHYEAVWGFAPEVTCPTPHIRPSRLGQTYVCYLAWAGEHLSMNVTEQEGRFRAESVSLPMAFWVEAAQTWATRAQLEAVLHDHVFWRAGVPLLLDCPGEDDRVALRPSAVCGFESGTARGEIEVKLNATNDAVVIELRTPVASKRRSEREVEAVLEREGRPSAVVCEGEALHVFPAGTTQACRDAAGHRFAVGLVGETWSVRPL